MELIRKHATSNRANACGQAAVPVDTQATADEAVPPGKQEASGEGNNERFHANENLFAYLYDGGLEELQCEARARLGKLLHSVAIDVDAGHNEYETGARAARKYVAEVFAGSFANEPGLIAFPNMARIDDLIVVGPLSLRRDCSDQACPIVGKLWIGMLLASGSNLAGLSKCSQLSDWITWRPQKQEEGLAQLADAMLDVLQPKGVALKLCVDHQCTPWPGQCDRGANTTMIVMRGAFLTQTQRRNEFLSNCSA
jgi:GTP cyclohydrolase I